MNDSFPRNVLRVIAVVAAALMVSAAVFPRDKPRELGARVFNRLVTGSAERAPNTTETLEFLEKVVHSADAELAQSGANPADVGDRAAALGERTEDLFAFVRDRIATEPYAGQLRGAPGALAARSGNSVDKSLLLAALLRARNRECRLVKATLSPEAAARLVAQTLATDQTTTALGDYRRSDTGDAALERLLTGVGREVAPVRELLAEISTEAAARATEARTLADAQAGFVLEQLAAANVAAPRSFETWREQLAQAVSEHVWVQVKTSNDPEQWLDLDPSFSGTKPGETFASDGVTVDGDPAERHAVQFTLVYRRTIAGEAEEKTLLDLTMLADASALAHAKFAIEPVDPLPGVEEAAQLSAADFKTLLREVKQFRALFVADGQTTASQTFDLEGQVNVGRAPGPQGLSMGGGFGLGGGDDDEGPKAGAKFVALVVKFSFRGPGAPATTQERVLFSAAERQQDCTATPLLEWQLALQPQVWSPSLAGYASLRHQLGLLGPALKILRGQTLGAEELGEIGAPASEPYSKLLMALAQVRQSALAEQLQHAPDVAVFFSTPQLVVAEERVCTCPERDSCGRVRIDIVSNGAAFVPRHARAELVARRAAVWQGVFDTVAETRLLRDASANGVVDSAIAVFEAARHGGAKLGVFAPGAENLPTEAAERAWISAFEPSDGLVVFAPASVPGAPGAWWSFDPQTGVTLGRIRGGRGGALVERTQTEKIAIKGLKCFASASFAFGKAGVKGGGKFTDADGWGYAVGTFSCVLDMTVAYTKMEYAAAYPRVAEFLDWAAPQIVDALRKGGPGK